jgi:hypothetical protein
MKTDQQSCAEPRGKRPYSHVMADVLRYRNMVGVLGNLAMTVIM